MDTNEEQIFFQASQIKDAAERDQFLVSQCHGDLPLLERIRGLLESQSDPSCIFNRESDVFGLINVDQSELDPIEGPGAKIGNYTLLEKIGEGGMGVVYKAEQTKPIQRFVALKILKRCLTSNFTAERFEAEIQTLAALDHPGITKIYDAGAAPSGRFFIVLELVHGEKINEYCDKRQLSVPERIGLVQQVCHIVNHAHRNGIIHRDLNPNNILISLSDQTAVAKLIDFGIAKALTTDREKQTHSMDLNDFAGTQEYMCPESANSSHPEDERCDIYSLGILLFGMVAGATPQKLLQNQLESTFSEPTEPKRLSKLPASTLLRRSPEILAVAAQNRRTNPHRLVRTLHGELDCILAKAITEDRADRYTSVADFADDLRRLLNNENVAAVTPSAGYRIRKFTSRNLPRLIIPGIIIAILLLGTLLQNFYGLAQNRGPQLQTWVKVDFENFQIPFSRNRLIKGESFIDDAKNEWAVKCGKIRHIDDRENSFLRLKSAVDLVFTPLNNVCHGVTEVEIVLVPDQSLQGTLRLSVLSNGVESDVKSQYLDTLPLDEGRILLRTELHSSGNFSLRLKLSRESSNLEIRSLTLRANPANVSQSASNH